MNEFTVLPIADTHTGHVTGLIPPEYDPKPAKSRASELELYHFRRGLWKFFTAGVDKLRPIEVAIGMGDVVDGPDRGASDYPGQTLIHDRGIQAEAAAAIFNWVGANKVIAIHGTPRHTGKEESWEEQAYRLVRNVKHVGVREVCDIAGLRIQIKHNLSRSSTPYGQPSILTKSAVMQELAALHEREVKAPLMLRAHVHMLVGVVSAYWQIWSLPSLQGATRYADGNGDGPTADMGMFWIKVRNAQSWRVGWELYQPYDPESAVIVL